MTTQHDNDSAVLFNVDILLVIFGNFILVMQNHNECEKLHLLQLPFIWFIPTCRNSVNGVTCIRIGLTHTI